MTTQLEAGQVWRYTTRPGEEDSRLTICLIESVSELGEIVHISIDDLRVKSPLSPGGVAREIHHMPFAADALHGSLLAMESKETELPDYREGYGNWKEAFENENAGVWRMSVADAIGAMEGILNQ